jgi:hypothetical protein
MDPFWTLLDSFGPTFKDTYQFVCLPCDYITSKKCNFEKHKLTAKHLRSNLDFQKVAKKVAKCVSTGEMLSDPLVGTTVCDDKKVARVLVKEAKMAKKVARAKNADDNGNNFIECCISIDSKVAKKVAPEEFADDNGFTIIEKLLNSEEKNEKKEKKVAVNLIPETKMAKKVAREEFTDDNGNSFVSEKVALYFDNELKMAKKVAHEIKPDDNDKDSEIEKVVLDCESETKMAKKVAREEFTDDNESSISKLNCHYCFKKYMSKSGLRKHLKCCIKPTEINTTDLIDIINKDKAIKMFLMEQNKQLIEQLSEQNNKLFEQNNKLMQIVENNKVVSTNTSTNILNTVTNNFNLNVFLNEKCKDALNIMDFVESLVVKVTDLEETTRLGYANGVSKIFIDGLKKLDIYKRPLHCSDLKREVIYIKDSNQWIKENDSKSTLMNAIKCVAKKNVQNIFEWQKLNPEYNDLQSKQSDRYNKIICESMSGSSKEEQLNNYEKIIKNIVKEVVIDKLK